MNWTKELPTEDGYYWFQSDWDGSSPEIVEFDSEEKIITFCGNEIGRGGWWSDPIEGKFWPVKLNPPSP